MRWHDLYLSGIGVWLPPRVDAATAIAEGRYTAEAYERSEQESVRVADEPAVDMAVRAARMALRRSGHAAEDISLLLYATANYQGLDAWNAASYVQRETGTSRAFAVEIRQLSNGSMAALELASGYLTAASSRPAALLVTGDRFALPGFDRWRADRSVVWGDAGTAVVLSRGRGFARLLSLASVSDPELEGLHRGDDPLRPSPAAEDMPVDIRRRQRAFFARMSVDEVKDRMQAGMGAAMEQALADADVSLDAVTRVVVPHLARDVFEWRCLAPLKVDLSRTTWAWGRTIGHLGAGDQFAGFAQVVANEGLRPGDTVLILGLGGGYNWTGAVVEVVAAPHWEEPEGEGDGRPGER